MSSVIKATPQKIGGAVKTHNERKVIKARHKQGAFSK